MRRAMQTAALAGTLGLMAAGIAGAQEPATPQKPASNEAAVIAAMQLSEADLRAQLKLAMMEIEQLRSAPIVRFDLEFPGGTVDEYIAAIRAAHPDANVVAQAEAVRFPMPPVSLKQVDTGAAARIISREIGNPTIGLSALRVREIEVKGSAESVYSVEAWSQPPQFTQSAVLSLAEVVGPGGKLKIEDVLSAIEAATNMTAPPPKIRYHAETSLLLFHGTKEQVDILQRTLVALQQTAAALE